MPTRLLLEGRDLEELLAQVRAEHGPDAVVVSAEKVRTGGVGGLFGTQKYELTVEVPDAAGTTEPPAGPTGQDDTPKRALSIEDLAAMADAAERPRASGSGAAFAEMLAAERPTTAADALNQLLAGEAGAPAEESAAPSVRPFRPSANQPVAKLGMRQVNAGPAPATTRPQAPAGPQDRVVAGPNRGSVAAGRGAAPGRPEPSGFDRTGYVPPGSVRPDPAGFRPGDSRQESVMPVEATATVEKPRTPPASERLASAYNPQGGTPSEPAERIERPERQTALSRKLQSLGVPTDLALRATSADTYSAIVEAFAALPDAEPAPDAPGETLVVVGESAHAVDVARWVAETQRLDGDHILFAGRNAAAAGIEAKRRITGPHDARLWAKKLRKSDAPSVVAVEAALDEAHWAAAIIEAVRPVAVWVVVDASRKTSDVAHHLQGLRRVDAICLRGTMASGDPASPLSLRLPVALLDGRPSTPYQWAAMLCERLSLVGG
ncbi:hypothetical protein Drose_31675 [Dactylosporangium roseum]|uniref:Uncharacterized protein n=1 Tax=Dactylosporangium roseum TaxID=47989 RepID=A0ABY5Z1F3_9ACTN|nr:hypothetical protein [Dactylosporangium roseum]UWZ35627.1 hypothetical protein Drose_31675 [Dactylosporangium roseum]